MPTVVSESYLSRSFTIGRQAVRELIYTITDAADEVAAETAMYATAPATYRGLVLTSIRCEPQGRGAGGEIWSGVASYSIREDNTEFTFDTGGGSTKITQSLSTVASYAPAGQTAPNFRGAIGVSDDKVEGVEIPAQQFQFTELHILTNASVTTAYKIALAGMTPAVNNATFRGFAAGAVLFLGASGSQRGAEDWSITFRFAVAPNLTGIEIGEADSGYYYNNPLISGIDKKGWEYLWVRYGDFEDSGAKALVKRPIAAYVEQVFYYANFANLGIGT
jgi:hypothetical protein